MSMPVNPSAIMASLPWYERAIAAVAPIYANQRLTARDSDKDVRHIELDLSASGLRYLPGDALGVFAPSPPALVAEVL